MKRSTGARTAALLVATTMAVVGLGACTSNSAKSAGGDTVAHRAGLAQAAGAPANASSAPAAGAANSAPRATTAGDLVLSSSKIRVAQLEVAVKRGQSVAAKADAANAIALGAGGEVDGDERTSGTYASASLVLRVPPDQLSQVLNELSRLGIEQSRQLSTQDVTAKVADVASRVSSAQVAIARLRALYQHATKVADVITIEGELSGRESDLEAMQAQQRALAAQTATAMITLSLTTQKAAAIAKHTTKHRRTGFVGGLRNGWDAFSKGAYALATAAGAFLPFALLLIVLALVARLLWPRLRSARRPAPAGPPAE